GPRKLRKSKPAPPECGAGSFLRSPARGRRCDVGEDAGGGLGRDDAYVLVLIDDDAVEQCPVEHSAFSGFTTVVEIAEVGEQVKELVEAVPSAGIGGRHGVKASGDLVEAGADALLLALEQVQRDRVGVVGLDELESCCFELVLLGFEELAFVVAGGLGWS